MVRGPVRVDGRTLIPTWRPARPHPFDVDAETDRITSEVWASDPRPERIVVAYGAASVKVGVPRTDDLAFLRAMVRDGLHELAELFT